MTAKFRESEPQMTPNDPKNRKGEYISFEEVSSKTKPWWVISAQNLVRRIRTPVAGVKLSVYRPALPKISIGDVISTGIKSGMVVGYVLGKAIVLSFGIVVHIVAVVLRVLHIVLLSVRNELRGMSMPRRTERATRRTRRQDKDTTTIIHNHINIY